MGASISDIVSGAQSSNSVDLTDPNSISDTSADSVPGGNQPEDDSSPIHLNYDFKDPSNLLAFLSGQPINVVSLTIDKTYMSGGNPITVLPPTLVASWFGVLNVTAGISITPSIGYAVHTKIGLDTAGFYVAH